MKKYFTIIFLIASHFAFSQSARFYVPYREGNKWGFCDTLGKIKIAPKYREVEFFKGNENTKNPIARVHINDTTYTFIDSTGKPIFPIFNNQTYFEFKFIDDKIYLEFYKDIDSEKRGLYINNKLISSYQCSSFIETYNNNIVAIKNGKYGMFSQTGDVVIPFQFDNISVSYYQTTSEKICWYCSKGKSKVKFEQTANTEFDFDDFKENYNSYLNELRDADDISKIEKTLEEERKRQETVNLKNPKAVDQNNGSLKYIRPKTELDTLHEIRDSLKKELKLDSIYMKWARKFFYVEKDGKQGFIDDSLKVFFMEKRYKIQEYGFNSTISWLYKKYQSLAIFTYEKNGKYGLSNEFDDTILAPIYDLIDLNLYSGTIRFKRNDKVGIFVINTFYNSFKDNYFWIERDSDDDLKVSDEWTFSLLKAYKKADPNKGLYITTNMYGTFLGYVGENGIEYFKN